jgi:hypothetical protein
MKSIRPGPGHQCCFCGRTIDESPRKLSLEVDGGGTQELFAHQECLRQRLHPSVPLAD